MLAQRYGIHPIVYSMTRTAQDMALDLRAWLQSFSVPAGLLMGGGKDSGRPERGRKKQKGSKHNFGKRWDWANRLKKPLAENTHLVELPPPDGRLSDHGSTRGKLAAQTSANSMWRIGKKRAKGDSFKLPPPPSFKGPGPVLRRTRGGDPVSSER